MSNNWDDWEHENYIVPVLNIEQLKRLEEQRLVEESDNALTKDLFDDEKIKILEINNLTN